LLRAHNTSGEAASDAIEYKDLAQKLFPT
jgi:hypothetical protein